MTEHLEPGCLDERYKTVARRVDDEANISFVRLDVIELDVERATPALSNGRGIRSPAFADLEGTRGRSRVARQNHQSYSGECEASVAPPRTANSESVELGLLHD